jgi:hypothetical protein
VLGEHLDRVVDLERGVDVASQFLEKVIEGFCRRRIRIVEKGPDPQAVTFGNLRDIGRP